MVIVPVIAGVGAAAARLATAAMARASQYDLIEDSGGCWRAASRSRGKASYVTSERAERENARPAANFQLIVGVSADFTLVRTTDRRNF